MSKKYHALVSVGEYRKRYSETTSTHFEPSGWNYLDHISGAIVLSTKDDDTPDKGIFLVTLQRVEDVDKVGLNIQDRADQKTLVEKMWHKETQNTQSVGRKFR